MDIAGVCLSKTKPGFSVGKLSIIINSILFTICAFIFDLQTSLYSIIFVAILYFISDRIHYQNINMTVLIFTKKREYEKCDHGKNRPWSNVLDGERCVYRYRPIYFILSLSISMRFVTSKNYQ